MRRALWLVVPFLALSLTPTRGDGPADVLDKAPSKFARFGDLKVHYKSLGEGKTAVVFIHGWCCDHTVWRAQAAAFNGKVRMLFVDLPGYGKSDRPKIDYTMAVFARGIDAVLQDAGVEQAVLSGHSMGTPVVREFYRLFPGKTRALIFVDGALRPFTNDPAVTKKFLSMFKEDTFQKDSSKFFAPMFRPNTPAAVREHIERLVANTSPQVAISSMHGMLDKKLWKQDPVKVPSQALMAKSPFWTKEYQEFAKKLVPDLDYREFDGVGHFLFMEAPKETNKALAEFLQKQGLLPRVNRANGQSVEKTKDGGKTSYEQAVHQLDKVLEANPANAKAYRDRGRACVDWAVAQDVALLAKADVDLLLAKADADLTRAIQLDPKLAVAYADRAGISNRKGRPAQALQDCNKALKLDPNLALAYRQRSWAYRSLKQLKEARRDADDLVRLDPKSGASYNARANISIEEKKYQEAVADFEKILEVEPTFVLGLNNYAWFLASCPQPETRNGKKAVALATQACELSRYQNAQHLDTLAAAHAEAGQFQGAQKWSLRALALPEAFSQEELTTMRARLELYKQGKAR